MTKKKAEIKKLEVDELEQIHLQQVFLDAYLEGCKFGYGCNVLQSILGGENKAESVVAGWMKDCPEFKDEFDEASRRVEWINAQKVIDFMVEVGSGQKLGNKNAKITNAQPTAGKMYLEAFDKAKYSPKMEIKKTETRTITTIIEHYGDKDNIVDAPEVKELPQGSDGSKD